VRKLFSFVVGVLAVVLAMLSLESQCCAKSSITNFTKSVFYVPPTNFVMYDFNRDPENYSDLFAYWGSGIQYEATDGDSILFDLRPAAYPVPNHSEQYSREAQMI
jgi:hypothetical protein